MIQSKDLRIGNIVDYNGEHLPVLAIDSENTFKDMEGTVTLPVMLGGYRISSVGRWCEHINGIPITPEWLERLGYKSNIRKTMFTIEFGEEKQLLTINCIAGEFSLSQYGTHLRYIHQLQNLTHILSGNELPIK